MKRLRPTDLRISQPLYTFAEAAQYLDLPASTLRSWAKPLEGPPLITIVSKRGFSASLPFIGFAEAFVIAAAKHAGVPGRRIRQNVAAIRQRAGGIEYALANRFVYTDGAELLLEVGGDGDLMVPRTMQGQMRATVENQLRLIQFAGDDYAERIQLPKYEIAEVTVDPRIASGRPLVESGAARVEDVVARVRAGDSVEAVGRDFAVPETEVRELVGRA